ncbi:MAG: periplasmic heavy metal sensor [Gemmobacter sp.]|uniref:periplasmic heavy metal sensor n=1 Tax=Gemmobacter sp. TaxID=1898957 RepID=UPI001A469119|nr:periplasmic heavy metal sensor [Gemmobacter sp.]MBL8562485.1 periplasmic heavy metal sensor [Gemmobacter sp.]
MAETQETQALPPAPKAAGRRWKWAFLGLLTLNLLAAGLIGGMIAKGPPMGDRAIRDLGFGLYGEALDEADRKALRKAFMEQGPGLRDMRKAMRADLAGVLAALRAEPFNPAALDAAFAQQTARLEEKMQLGQALLRDRLVGMTPEQRRAFADRLERSVIRHAHKGGPEAGRDGARQD